MSASLNKTVKEHVSKELDAAYILIKSLSHSLTELEKRVKALEDKNGNRQRRTNRSD